MRLPRRKIWRAFPELDRFPDDQCERFVLRAAQEYRASKARVMLLTAGLLAVSATGIVSLVGLVWRQCSAWLAIHTGWVHSFLVSAETKYISIVLLVGVCGIAMLVVRDQWLIRTITRKLRQTNCAKCGYSLLGLVPDRGVVQCPECQHPFFLGDAGMSDDDLLSG
jgi:hypothetical protein